MKRIDYIFLSVLILTVAASCVASYRLAHPKLHANPCTVNRGDCYSIQGLYSKEDCPDQHPWYVWAGNPPRWFFMGCRD